MKKNIVLCIMYLTEGGHYNIMYLVLNLLVILYYTMKMNTLYLLCFIKLYLFCWLFIKMYFICIC